MSERDVPPCPFCGKARKDVSRVEQAQKGKTATKWVRVHSDTGLELCSEGTKRWARFGGLPARWLL